MDNREKILMAIRKQASVDAPLPAIEIHEEGDPDLEQQFCKTLESIGGRAFLVKDRVEAIQKTKQLFPDRERCVDLLNQPGHSGLSSGTDPRKLNNLDLAIIPARFAVAENGSVWITDDQLPVRVLPFIAEHLVVFLPASSVVANMHQAYEQIGMTDYSFAVFIAGPSKTADIEQSLVLGAQGPRSMTVLLLSE